MEKQTDTSTPFNYVDLLQARDFNPAVATDLLEAIASGIPVTKALKKVANAPSYGTLQAWRRDYPEFAVAFVQAKQAAAEMFAGEVYELTEEVRYGGVEPAAAKVAMDGKRWLASKFAPREYGERLALDGQVSVSHKLASMSDDSLDDEIKRLQESVTGTERHDREK